MLTSTNAAQTPPVCLLTAELRRSRAERRWYGRPSSRSLLRGVPLDASLESSLTDSGLTRDEARSYIALLARGRLTARQLCAATGISRGRIYDVAGGLVAKGVAVEMTTDVRAFEAATPQVALANLLEKRRREFEQVEAAAEELQAALAAAASDAVAGPSLIEWLRHGATIAERCRDLVEEANEQVLWCVRRLSARTPDEFDPERLAIARGVEVRAVYESALLDHEHAANVQRYISGGVHARHVGSLPTQLLVVDRRVTMLPLEEPASARNRTVLVIRHRGVSTLAALAFEALWERGTPIQRARERSSS